MAVLRNIGLAATCRAEGGQADVHLIPDAAIAFRDGTITWVGRASELPASQDEGTQWDAGGRLVVPGLVDAHTHLVFGGWRADELVQRLAGKSYEDIARAGGGIAATVAKTRALSPEALVERGRTFVHEMSTLGVTTVEAKSGYGLDKQTELAILRAYHVLDSEGPLRIVATYLGAHVVPPEHRERRGDYLALVVSEMLPRVARERLARFCDVFVAEGAFSLAEARPVVSAARALGLGVKIHADQLADDGGAAFAAGAGAVSADHLEHVSLAGIQALAQAGTVAVMLPIATLYLGQRPPPVRALIDAGVPVAVATDFNPGTAPSYHLPWAMTLACVQHRMLPAEALKGATIYAARAIGLEAEIGSLEPGKAADFAVIDARDIDHWLYHFRANACLATVRGGAAIWQAPGWALA